MLLAASGDVRMLVGGGVFGARRIARHLWRMCFGLFIAAGSFFLGPSNRPLRLLSAVGLGQHLSPSLFSTTLYSILSILPLILLIFWLVRVRFTNAYQSSIRAVSAGPDLTRQLRSTDPWSGECRDCDVRVASHLDAIPATLDVESALAIALRHQLFKLSGTSTVLASSSLQTTTSIVSPGPFPIYSRVNFTAPILRILRSFLPRPYCNLLVCRLVHPRTRGVAAGRTHAALRGYLRLPMVM
jgi:hypothetical protein